MDYPELNFPEYDFRITEKDGKLYIFDPVRRKQVRLTPEEWVRQHVIRFLMEEHGVPGALIRTEAEITLHRTRKRFDIAVYERNGRPLMAVECKAPGVPLSQQELDQLVRYNMTLKVRFLVLTNGIRHLYFEHIAGSSILRPLEKLPGYTEMIA